MSDIAEIVIGTLGSFLFVLSAYGVMVGGEAALSGERIERCPKCHRRAWTTHGTVHPDGCPRSMRARAGRIPKVLARPRAPWRLDGPEMSQHWRLRH